MIRNIIAFALIITSLNCYAQHSDDDFWNENNLKDSLNSLKYDLREILYDHWIMTNTDSSIVISYCQSCINEYKEKLQEFNDSIKTEKRPDIHKGKNAYKKQYLPLQENKPKYGEYCNLKNKDSVSCNSILSNISGVRRVYKNNAVLQFTFDFKPKNRNDNFERIKQSNDSIAEIIKDRPLKIPASIFDDYRFYEYDQLKRFDSSFTISKLPYHSKNYNYNIYFYSTIDLNHNKVKFQNSEGKITNLNSDIARTLIVVSHCLGIENYVDHVIKDYRLK